MVGDVTVVGIDAATVPLTDIGMDVPHGHAITIPADLATMSKDLWRAIGQKRLFQLHSGPTATRPQVHPGTNVEPSQDRLRTLEAENQQLREQVAHLEAGQADGNLKLDRILSLLQSTGGVAPRPNARESTPARPAYEVVDEAVPLFVPDFKPKDAGESRLVEVQAESTDGSGLGSAAEALRKMRRGQ